MRGHGTASQRGATELTRIVLSWRQWASPARDRQTEGCAGNTGTEPNNFGDGENCMAVYGNGCGLWYDHSCDVPKSFVCQGLPFTYFSQTLSWSDAFAACVNSGGTLAKITSTAEQDILVAIAGGNDIWIGGTDRVTEGTWQWAAGGSFPPTADADQAFENWANPARDRVTRGCEQVSGTEPNNFGDGENCLAAYGNGCGLWYGTDFKVLTFSSLRGGARADEHVSAHLRQITRALRTKRSSAKEFPSMAASPPASCSRRRRRRHALPAGRTTPLPERRAQAVLTSGTRPVLCGLCRASVSATAVT